MPIYEYRCTACAHEFDALQKLSDPLLRTCPKCGKNELAKQLSAAGFQLKGSGWYATDFKNAGSKPAKPAANPEAKADGGDKAATPATETKAGEAKTKSDAPATPSGTKAPADS